MSTTSKDLQAAMSSILGGNTKPKWNDYPVQNFAGGINTFLDSDNISDNEVLCAENMRLFADLLEADKGYSGIHESEDLLGTIQEQHTLKLKTGQNKYFLFTTATIYLYDTDQWIGVSTSVDDVLDTSHVTNDTVLGVADTTGFAVDDYVKVELDDGSYHHAQIDAISAGASITIDIGIPSAAASANTITKIVTLTGTVENRIDVETIPWDDQFVFTNGLDAIQYYDDGTGVVGNVSGLPSSGDCLALSLAIFDNSLFLFNTTEGGDSHPRRVRYCDTADITEWTNGTAGYIDLYENSYPIITGKVLGPYLILYKQKGIRRLLPSQAASKRFENDGLIEDEGIFSINSVVSISNNRHAFWGRSNIYLYKGGFDMEPVGEKIKKQIFGASSNVDPSLHTMKKLYHLADKDELIISYQKVGDTVPKTTYRLNLLTQGWTGPREYTDGLWSMGHLENSSPVTWDDLTGSWDTQDYPWVSTVLSGVDSFRVIGGTNRVYQYNDTDGDDNGTSINYTVDTKDFEEEYEVLLDWIDVKCTGSDDTDASKVTVYISADRGNSWVELGKCNASTTPQWFRLFKQITCKHYRLRFTTQSSAFALYEINRRQIEVTEKIDFGTIS